MTSQNENRSDGVQSDAERQELNSNTDIQNVSETTAPDNHDFTQLKPDLEEAKKFLKMLDNMTTDFAYRTFDDVKVEDGSKRYNGHLAGNMYGKIEDCIAGLAGYQRGGAGVFVTANRTDGEGAKAVNITSLRCVWIDDDTPRETFRTDFPHDPTVIVESSPGKYHYWWRKGHVGKFEPDVFKGVMKRLVQDWGHDKQACDIARVMRLPGFYHLKGEPFMSRIVGGTGEMVPLADLLKAFPPIEEEQIQIFDKETAEITLPSNSYDLVGKVHDALRSMPQQFCDNRDTWVEMGMGLNHEFGEAGFVMWEDWSRRSAKYNFEDCVRVWKSFGGQGTGTTTIKTIFHYSQGAGYWAQIPMLPQEVFDAITQSFMDKRNSKDKIVSSSNEQIKSPQPSLNDNSQDEIRSRPWPKLPPAAMPGWVGDFVELACRQSEADPAAVLGTLLAQAGAVFGQTARVSVGETKHHPCLFLVAVGASSRARKGTSKYPVERVFNEAEQLLQQRSFMLEPLKIAPGPLSSGEGIVFAIRDPSEAVDDTGAPIDPGVTDKRLFVVEEEFGSVLNMKHRDGNTLSTTLRLLWDGRTVEPLIKTNKTKASNPRVSIVGHITEKELQSLLSASDTFNGFANRFLWIVVRRPKLVSLPPPMPDDEVYDIATKLADAIQYNLGGNGSITISPETREIWNSIYPELTKDYTGVFGVVTARAEAQAVRLMLIYALLDSADQVDPKHLESALAFLQFCKDSTRHIFGESEIDPHANKVLAALKDGPKSKTELHTLFSNHMSKIQLAQLLDELQGSGKVTLTKEPTGGRPIERWSLNVGGAK